MQSTVHLQEDAVPIVRASLDMKRRALEFALRQYQTRLSAFESLHHMTSELFAEKYNRGELGDNEQWFEWEFTLDAAREATRQLTLLADVRL